MSKDIEKYLLVLIFKSIQKKYSKERDIGIIIFQLQVGTPNGLNGPRAPNPVEVERKQEDEPAQTLPHQMEDRIVSNKKWDPLRKKRHVMVILVKVSVFFLVCLIYLIGLITAMKILFFRLLSKKIIFHSFKLVLLEV